MKKVIAMLLSICLVVACFAGCGKTGDAAKAPEDSAELPILKVAVQPYLLAIPVYYMMENGLDKANGFEIDLSVYVNGTLINEALAANEWDVATGGTSAVFGIATYGAKIIADIDLCTGGAAAYVRPDSPIAAVKDKIAPNVYGDAETLKGAQILVPTGTLNQYNALKWVEKAGLTSEDVEFVHMDNASSFQAFATGEGDITAFSPPMTYQAEAEGWVTAASCSDLGLYCWDPLLANPNTLDEKMDTICAFVKTLYEVQDTLAADKNLAAEWSVKWQAYNGVTTTIEDSLREVNARPFMTSAELDKENVGQTIYDVAEFFNSVDSLSDEDLEKIPANITTEVLDRVFG